MLCRFGGDHSYLFQNYSRLYNDTWSFDISTQKWTELQCTGSILCPRRGHGAVVVDDVMYVFGGEVTNGTNLDDLTALNLSSGLAYSASCTRSNEYPAQRWTTFQDIGPGPSRRRHHVMASDGTWVFVFGGVISSEVQADRAKSIHVLDTSMYFLFVVSFEWPPRSKTQKGSVPRNPTLTMSILVRKPPSLRGYHSRIL